MPTTMRRVREVKAKPAWRGTMVHPHSPQRLGWDLTSLLVVFWDMAWIPLAVFDPQESDLTKSMTWLTRIFWNLDVVATLRSGVILGSVELRPYPIFRRYLSTWFALDAFLITVDWLEVISLGLGNDPSEGAGLLRAGKVTRGARMIRIFRLFRILKLRKVLQLFTERIQSERLAIVIQIVQIMFLIVWASHFLGCIWYGLGKYSADVFSGVERELSWVAQGGFEEEGVSASYRYFTALHWSVSQLTGGMDEVKPYNLPERVYAVLTLMAAFMVASMVVSALSSSITRLHILASRQSRQISSLRRYLSQNGISDRLQMRVMRNAQHVMHEQMRMMPESKVELLGLISLPLREELDFEMYHPALDVHPLFAAFSTQCPHVMRRICHEACSALLLSKGDIIFNCGEIPVHPAMYFVVNGSCEYLSVAGALKPVTAGTWVAEPCLWTQWVHCGLLRAQENTRLCALDANLFQYVANSFGVGIPGFIDPRTYGENFINNLNYISKDNSLSDLSTGAEMKALRRSSGAGNFAVGPGRPLLANLIGRSSILISELIPKNARLGKPKTGQTSIAEAEQEAEERWGHGARGSVSRKSSQKRSTQEPRSSFDSIQNLPAQLE